ncbi:hypothetical protein TNCV_2957791 [Trichonephila clavipes]|nr:hypothetical protein TNCV_2957791 [Trichonephila clavipes]
MVNHELYLKVAAASLDLQCAKKTILHKNDPIHKTTLLKIWNDMVVQKTALTSDGNGNTESKAPISSKKYGPMINDAVNSHHKVTFSG